MEAIGLNNDSTKHTGSPCSLFGKTDASGSNTLCSSSPTSHDAASPSSSDGPDHHQRLTLPTPAVSWSALDEHFTQLFRGWLDLPLSPSSSWEVQLSVLRDLEHVIVPFEQAIQDSDRLFAVWRSRHQAAMEVGLSTEPSWPKLYDASKGWLDDKWIERYRYLVNMREKLLAWRCSSLGLGRLDFPRGPPIPRPGRITLKKGKNKQHYSNNGLPQFWARSVDEILMEQAERQGVDAQTVVARFWDRPPASEEVPGLINMSSESELSSPPQESRTPGCNQYPSRDMTPTPVAKAKRVYPEVIKIESDSD